MPRPLASHVALPLALFGALGATSLTAQDLAAYTLLVQRGDAALDRFDLETAEARFAEAVKAGEAAGVPALQLIELEQRLGRVQGLRAANDQAIATLRHAIERLEKLPDAPNTLRISCLEDLAVRFRDKGDAQASLDSVRRALALVKPDTEDADAVRLRLLDHFVKAALMKADPAAVLDGANQRTEILGRKLGADNPDLILPLKQAAQALHALGRDREAIPLIQRWIQIHEKVRGVDHPSIAEGLENLLVCQTSAGDLDAADATVQRWTRILSKVMPDHPVLVDTSQWTARILSLRGQHAEAADELEKALTLGRKVQWDRKSRLGQLALDLARENRLGGRLDRAKTALHDAQTFYGTLGKEAVETLRLELESANLLLAEGDAAAAATAMTTTVANLEARFGKQHRSLIEPLEILSRAYLGLDRKADAEAAAQRAKAIAAKR